MNTEIGLLDFRIRAKKKVFNFCNRGGFLDLCRQTPSEFQLCRPVLNQSKDVKPTVHCDERSSPGFKTTVLELGQALKVFAPIRL